MPGPGVPNPLRRRARERAVQYLFGLEFTGHDWRSSLDGFWETNPARPGVKKYARELIEGVHANLDALDEAIAAALQHWTPDRVGRIERSILRIALYEMRYAEDVPLNVAINEAIEVAKRYGGEDAPRFVNGVLDRLKNRDANTVAPA